MCSQKIQLQNGENYPVYIITTVPTRPSLTPEQTLTKPQVYFRGLLLVNVCPDGVYFWSTRGLL